MNITADIKAEIQKAAKKLWPKLELPEVVITESPRAEFGDYSCPLSLGIGKLTNTNPIEVAENINKQLGKIKYIKETSVTKPGFINFTIDYQNLADDLISKNQKVSIAKPENIIVEHASVNPNKAAHIGHLRNVCLGDSYVRTLKYLGHNVEVQNYIDDLGKQVADSVMALREFGDAPKGKEIDEWYWEIYARIQEKLDNDPKAVAQREDILHEMEAGKNDDAKRIVSEMVDAHLKTFKKFDIEYDVLVYEHDIIDNHLWEKVFEDLKKKKLIVQPATGDNKGAWVVEFGDTDRENKILVKQNGLPTYTAKDIAYHLWTFNVLKMSGYQHKLVSVDKFVNVVDERQTYPLAVVKYALTELGYTKEAKNSIHLSYGVVNISEKAMKEIGQVAGDKSTHSMSGRKGTGITINNLLDTVINKQIKDHKTDKNIAKDMAVGSIRYYMLRTRPLREIVFDFDEALKTDGNTGIYLQYAFARANQILEKASKVSAGKTPNELSHHEQQLIKILSEFENYITESADSYDPSVICDYAYSLASAFAKFYETSPVLKSEDEVKSFRLGLVSKYKDTLEIVLGLIGIPALPRI